MDNVIKIALKNELNQLKENLCDARVSYADSRRVSILYYKNYKKAKLRIAAYEDAIARIEKELKNGK